MVLLCPYNIVAVESEEIIQVLVFHNGGHVMTVVECWYGVLVIGQL